MKGIAKITPFILVATLIASAFAGASAAGQDTVQVFLPIIIGPPCNTDQPIGEEDRLPDGTWYPEGTWRTVVTWFPGGGQFEAEHKLLLAPGQQVGLIGAGGHSWAYCSEAGARANFEQIARDEVTVQQLLAAGLAVEGLQVTATATATLPTATSTATPTATPTNTQTPTATPPVCSDPAPETHAPNGTWFPQGEERVVNVWFPNGGPYQAEHKLRLRPWDLVGLRGGGGTSWGWPAGCLEVAQANFELNPLDEVTLDELDQADLIDWASAPSTPTATTAP